MIKISQPSIGDEEKRAVLSVLESGMLAQGPQVERFEGLFAEYCGAKHAVAVSSGTAALHLALLAQGIGHGDEVITTPFSFIATGNAIRYVGAQPVFVDIDPVTFNIDPAEVALHLTPRTRSILPVHLFGHPADIGPLKELASRHRLFLIEDACQAHGAEYCGRRIGSSGTACFSFYPTKNMTTAEGGMVVTDDPQLADRLRVLRNHGMRRRYFHETLGFNFRMTEVHAAIGIAQLSKLDEFNRLRMRNAAFLSQNLPHAAVKCPNTRGDVCHVFHQYTVRVPSGRDSLRASLAEAGIDSAIYYPVPIHLQEPFACLTSQRYSLPESEKAANEVLSLPVHPCLTEQDLDTIVSAVRKWAYGRTDEVTG